MRKELEQLMQVEVDCDVEVLYCSEVGSKLFGTNHAESDSDYRFLFKNSLENTLLNKAVDSIKIGKQTNQKNTKDDVDFDGWSVQHWFKLLQKGETNALNLLFSMFKSDTILMENTDFTDSMKENYDKLLTRNMGSFKGYALSQAKRFGIKGEKYAELCDFKEYIKSFPTFKDMKLLEFFESAKEQIKVKEYKHIKFVMADGPRGTNFQGEISYISVLGKMFEGNVTFEYFANSISKLHGGFGNRTKTIASTVSKTDWKAMSHAQLVSNLCVELLTEKFMKFPVSNKEYILKIKHGEIPAEDVVNEIEKTLERVELELLNTNLPELVDRDFMDKSILDLYK